LLGPRAHLPDRDYLLYTGPAEAAVTTEPLSDEAQSANLWWPADRAWCVASEIDLAWTYVAGAAGLIQRGLAEEGVEALPAGPDDPATRVEPWVAGWVAAAVAMLLSTGEAVITTSRGTVQARLERPSWRGPGMLRTHGSGENGVSSTGERPLRGRDEKGLRDELTMDLSCEVIGLAGG